MTLFPDITDTDLRPRRRDMAHAAKPGTGPEGETCGTCRHLARLQYQNVYLKCGLMKAVWTGGRATDIRCKDAACRMWEQTP